MCVRRRENGFIRKWGKTAEIVRQRRTSRRYTLWNRLSILKVNTYYMV